MPMATNQPPAVKDGATTVTPAVVAPQWFGLSSMTDRELTSLLAAVKSQIATRAIG